MEGSVQFAITLFYGKIGRRLRRLCKFHIAADSDGNQRAQNCSAVGEDERPRRVGMQLIFDDRAHRRQTGVNRLSEVVQDGRPTLLYQASPL